MNDDVDMTALQLKLEDRSTTFDEKDVWADDRLGGLNDKSKTLIELIQGQQRPLTICLDGEWGSCKTFFLTRLAHDYNALEGGARAIYYNAWQDDFLDDPLLAIICQLEKIFVGRKEKSIIKRIKHAAIPCLTIAASIGKQLAEKVTGIDVDSTKEALKTKKGALFEKYQKMDASRGILKKAIANLSEATWKETGKPLLFIIDELDRCRPTFAIELLERVKHLFNVPHLVFLVGVDLGELGKSIQSVYGDIKSADYLHRFFDVEMKLPNADKRGFIDYLWKEHGLEGVLKPFGFDVQTQYTMVQAFEKLIAYQNMTLRQIEKSVRTFALLATSGQQAARHWPFLTAIAVVLKVAGGDSYEKFVHMKDKLGDLINALYPGATYKEVDEENYIFNEVSHLTKIAYCISDTSATHLKLEGLKKVMSEKGHITFDPDIMPECFRECPQEYILSFYNGFIHLLTKDNQIMYQSYRDARAVLRQIDRGLRFIG